MPLKISQKGIIPVIALILILAIAAAGILAYYYFTAGQGNPVLPVSQNTLTLALESPIEDTLITDNRVLVKGKTLPGTTVAFYTDADTNSVEADASGNFEGTVGLVEGINTLTITAFSENGEEKSTTMDIVNDHEK